MSALDTMGRIAEFLPAEEREAYFRVLTRLREVPEDDEYLLVLEAIGFTSLILREIPSQVKEVLAGAGSIEGVEEASTEYLLRQMEKVIEGAIQLPSFEDGKRQRDDFLVAQRGFTEEVRSLTRCLQEHSTSLSPGKGRTWSTGWFAFGATVMWLLLRIW